jgi:hypothetical protein
MHLPYRHITLILKKLKGEISISLTARDDKQDPKNRGCLIIRVCYGFAAAHQHLDSIYGLQKRNDAGRGSRLLNENPHPNQVKQQSRHNNYKILQLKHVMEVPLYQKHTRL